MFLDILTKQLLSLLVSDRGALQHSQRSSGAGNLDLLMHPIQSQRAKTQPDRYSPMETRAKLLGPPRYTASFFPSIIALQFYLNCHSCSQHCKTTQAGEGKGNPIPTYGKVHSKHGGAITSPHWSYSRGKSNTDNKAGMARILRAFSRHLHGFKEDTICAIGQSTTHLEACREFWKDQLQVHSRVAHLRAVSPRE